MFGRIKEGIDKSIVSVSVKSATYLETEKLKTKEGNARAQIAGLAAEMGQAVYEQWKCGQVSQEYIDTICSRMKALECEALKYREEIQKLQEEKEKILGGNPAGAGNAAEGVLCVCGYVNEAGARFCVQCGKLLQEPEPARDVQEAEQRLCPVCGAAYEPGARFCVGCGSPLEAPGND